jgi:hypothetical protein
MKSHFKAFAGVALAAVAAVAAGANGAARAADTGPQGGSGYAAVEMPVTWTGFYLGTGILGSGTLAGVRSGTSGPQYSLPLRGTQGGWFAAGYNLQLGPAIFGVECNPGYAQTGSGGSNAVLGQVTMFQQDLGSVHARAGLVYSNLLLYGLGGLELTRLKVSASGGMRNNSWDYSLVVGGGLEYAADPYRMLLLRAEASVYGVEQKNLAFTGGNRDAYEDFGVLRIGIVRKY